ncbi:hypothetical protein ACGF3G_04970 [Streptomyces sp. NPDC048179]|uniref:hypothetical protein n=1 Tax=Streptomyces sp. NPDC048179 TaxID=3365506 RepID=UPI0037173A0D
MGGLIETAAGVIDRRLLASTFLPVLAFLAGLASVIAAGVGWTETARWWSATDAEIRVLLLLLVLIAALILTQLLAVGRMELIRLYEGYWAGLPCGTWLARRLTERHRWLYRSLTDRDPEWLLYPMGEEQVMPTTVGNILRGAEEHSAERYGINAVTTWPRLYPTLPETFRQTYVAAAADLELAITASVLGAAFAALGGILGTVLLAWPGTLLCVSTGTLVAGLGYRGAVSGAKSYSRLVRAAFDVHRWCLLDAMGLARPANVQVELDQWRALDKLWVLGSVDTDQADALGYPADAPPASPDPHPHPTRPERMPPDSRMRTEAGHPPTRSDAPSGLAPPSHGPRPLVTDRRRRIRPAAFVLLVFFLGSCVAVAVNAEHPPRRPTAVRDLPAYHVIVEGDVHGPGEKEVRSRYTLHEIPAGSTVRSTDLGPRIRPGELASKAVIALGPPTARIQAPAGTTGATLTLLIVPTGSRDHPLSVPDAVVVALHGEREHLSAVIAIPSDRLDQLVTRLDGSTVYLLVPGK